MTLQQISQKFTSSPTFPNSRSKSPIKNPHPLRLLSDSEISSLSDYISSYHQSNSSCRIHMFYTMDLQDPDKVALWNWEKNEMDRDTEGERSPLQRHVKVVFIDQKWAVWEYLVHLSNYTDGKILRLVSRQNVKGVQPLIREEEFMFAQEAALNDERVIKLFREDYGIKGDLNLVCVDPWSNGYYGTTEWEKTHRIVRCLVWARMEDPEDNRFAHPVSGVNIVVDILNKKVLEVNEFLKEKPPVPLRRANFHPRMRKKDLGNKFEPRTDIKPLEITQPQGPSFNVDGNHVEWQGWSFRVGFQPREGLVLHNMKFQNRPVCFKASVPEMSVPYGEPTVKRMGSSKCALDSGEYGLGYCANSLELGCDCLGFIHYFDARLHDFKGKPYTIKNAICLHEEDAGVLFKHVDWRTGANVTARARELIVNFSATIGNYIYAFRYKFNQEGQLALDVDLHGILNTRAIFPGDTRERHGTELMDGVYAGIHQHLFAVRLDMCVDGVKNTISEVNIGLEEDDSINDFGNAFYATFTDLKTQREAQRNNSTQTSRFWHIYNKEKKNVMGKPVGYDFVPGHNIQIHSKKNSYMLNRCPWLNHHLFVTKHSVDHQYPSGDYANQSSGKNCPTLQDWVNQDTSIVDQNLVLWHSCGVTHLPRPCEWPLMAKHQMRAFKIQPNGFFDENPCMDVPTNIPLGEEGCKCTKSKL